jgi:hypothetical protein
MRIRIVIRVLPHVVHPFMPSRLHRVACGRLLGQMMYGEFRKEQQRQVNIVRVELWTP